MALKNIWLETKNHRHWIRKSCGGDRGMFEERIRNINI